MTEQLFYVSTATYPHNEAVVRSILQSAQRKNPARDVTGCLLYSGLHFGQVLEARADVILQMIGALLCDTRHSDFKILYQVPIERRTYGAWTMGYMHSLDLQDRLESLARTNEPDPLDVMLMRQAIQPNPLTGMAS